MSEAGSRERENMVAVGSVTKPHGVRGCVRVLSFDPKSESLLETKKVFLKSPEAGELKEFEILEASRHKQFFLVQLKGITNMDEAGALKGWIVCVPDDEPSSLGEGEYYYDELIDMQAYLSSDEFLGKIAGFIETPAHDVMVIKNGDREFMLPMIDDVVVEVDKKNKKVVLFTEGLIVESE